MKALVWIHYPPMYSIFRPSKMAIIPLATITQTICPWFWNYIVINTQPCCHFLDSLLNHITKRSNLRPAIRGRGLLLQISLIIKLFNFLEMKWYPFTSDLFYPVIILSSHRTIYTSEIVCPLPFEWSVSYSRKLS